MSNTTAAKNHAKKLRRARRVRSRVQGTTLAPRLSVMRSAKHISAQIIDDSTGKTLASASDKGLKAGNPTELAKEVGKVLAKNAVEAKITRVVFDRGAYRYHGRVAALANGAREGGLTF